MAVHRDNAFPRRKSKALAGGLHDADVGLMGYQPVDLLYRGACRLHYLLGNLGKHPNCKLEHGLAVHAQERIADGLAATHLTRNRKKSMVGTIGMDCGGKNARLILGLQYYRARSVAEKYAGAAILPVENP